MMIKERLRWRGMNRWMLKKVGCPNSAGIMIKERGKSSKKWCEYPFNILWRQTDADLPGWMREKRRKGMPKKLNSWALFFFHPLLQKKDKNKPGNTLCSKQRMNTCFHRSVNAVNGGRRDTFLIEKHPYWGQRKALPRRPACEGGHCGARHTPGTSVRACDMLHVSARARGSLLRQSRYPIQRSSSGSSSGIFF